MSDDSGCQLVGKVMLSDSAMTPLGQGVAMSTTHKVANGQCCRDAAQFSHKPQNDLSGQAVCSRRLWPTAYAKEVASLERRSDTLMLYGSSQHDPCGHQHSIP